MATPYHHTLPGEFRHDGIAYIHMVKQETLDAIPSMPLRPDDVLVTCYPKSGTTWMCEIIAQLFNDSSALRLPINTRTPNVEFSRAGQPSGMIQLADKPSPRAFFSHLRAHFYEAEFWAHRPRVIFLLRNPKDLLVSYYHFFRASGDLGQFTGSFQQFMEVIVKEDRLPFGDPVEYIRSWYRLKDEPNVLVIKYEDMKENHQMAVTTVAKHLGYDVTQQQIQDIVAKTSFSSMQKNPLANRKALSSTQYNSSISQFIRKGEVGDWQNYMSKEDEEYVDRTICEPLREMGLTFRYV